VAVKATTASASHEFLIGGFFMSTNIVPITSHRKYVKGRRRGRYRVFNLGLHSYSGAPGLSWQTNYWVKSVSKGTEWELYCSPEEALSRREYSGTFTVHQLREMFEEVEFFLEEDHWRELGLGWCATVIQFAPKSSRFKKRLAWMS